MNSMDYLNQISADNRQVATPKTGFSLDNLPLPKNLIKWLGLAIGAVLLLVIIVAIIPTSSGGGQSLIEKINLRSTNLMKTITDYNPQIKSSRLRAISNNVSSVLTVIESQTYTTLLENYSSDGKKYAYSDSVTAEEDEHIAKVNSTLETARIEATMDRTYLRVLTRETAYMINLSNELLSVTKSDALASSMATSINNLNSLYTELQNFTDPTL